jgi:ketosteroid isomerase-like protein
MMLIAVACLSVAYGCGSGDGLSSDIKDLVEAEHRFARDAAERGIKTAFLSNLSGHAVLFRPYPVNGREWFQDQPETDAFLGWVPVVSDVSDAGDLGYTTGPWSYSAEGAGVEPNIFGEYVSVWSKTPKGNWQVVIDVGTSHDQPVDEVPTLTVPQRDRRREGWDSVNVSSVLGRLRETERDFAEVCRVDGEAVAYDRYAAEDMRYLPVNDFPVTGADVVAMKFEGKEERRIYRQIGGDVSRSGDLGYVYGKGGITGDDATGAYASEFCYLRIWTRGHDSQWRLALDVSEPVPARSDAPEGEQNNE